MKNLNSSANVLYGFSSGCLIAAALSFFETSELSFTLFCFAVSAFVVAELIENVILPIYSAKLKKRINVLHTSTPTITITGIIRKEK